MDNISSDDYLDFIIVSQKIFLSTFRDYLDTKGNFHVNLLFFRIILSAVLSKISACFLVKLYARNLEILSYPSKIFSNSLPRFFFLFLGTAASSIFLTVQGEDFFSTLIKIFLVHLMLVTICTDFEQEVIFDKVILLVAICGVIFVKYFSLPVTEHLIAGIFSGGIFFLLALTGGIGGGDVKLMAALGFLLGEKIIDVALIGMVGGGIIALILLATGKKKRTDFFAYGIFFAGAAIFEILLFHSP